MKFQPKTEKQIAEEGLMPEGVYSFEVSGAKDAVSKNGNDMIELKLRIFDNEGNSRGMITDFLMEKIAYKLRHAADACGVLDKYESGEILACDFENKMGEVKVRIQKDKNGQYPDKNIIADYVVKKEAAVAGNSAGAPPPGHPAADPFHDPDMPF